ncbi:MAG: C13 family peptidase [Gemmatimonadales bacterium]
MRAALLATLGLAAVAPLPAQGLKVLVVSGLSGEPQYAKSFAANAGALIEQATNAWRVPESDLVYLAERPAADPGRITGRATRDEVLSQIGKLATSARPEDVVLIFLLGHGSQQGDEARLSLPGPDLTAGDLAGALSAFTTQTVVVVNSASASGEFVKPLSGKRRVIVAATKTGFERNATSFADHFVKGLAGGADTDKDGRTSVAEAFVFAKAEVARQYEAERRLLTEHAILDDDGDGAGSADLGKGTDGALARAVSFGGGASALADDPRAAPLLAERKRLETAIAELRQRKASMDSTAYERELETLLLSLARTNQALRALDAKP